VIKEILKAKQCVKRGIISFQKKSRLILVGNRMIFYLHIYTGFPEKEEN
jgi:hypothetical protein